MKYAVLKSLVAAGVPSARSTAEPERQTLEIVGGDVECLGNFREHSWPNLFALMEGPRGLSPFWMDHLNMR